MNSDVNEIVDNEMVEHVFTASITGRRFVQGFIALDDEAWDDFAAALDAPVKLDPAVKARYTRPPQRDRHARLTEEDRAFLLSVKGRKPDWSLIDLPGIADLPAVRGKLVNLDRMSEAKHAAVLDRLRQVLGM